MDSVFGQLSQVLSPVKGVKKLGSTRTTNGGKFKTTLKVPAGVAVAARTGADNAGASCAVHVS